MYTYSIKYLYFKMGIKNLNTLILQCTKNSVNKKHLSEYSNKKVAIDANVYIYKYLYGNNNSINGIFFQVNKLKKHGIIPIYVFDGKPPIEKQSTILNRKCTKNKWKQKILYLENKINLLDKDITIDQLEKEKIKIKLKNDIENLNNKLVFITKEVINNITKLLDHMGVNYIFAPCEAEHYCSALVKNNLVDLVLSEDMDTIACGSKYTLRQFSNKLDYVMEYDLNSLLNELKLNYDEFIDLCILCGNDYISRLRDIDYRLAHKLINKYKSIEEIDLNCNLIKFPENYDFKTSRNIYNLKNISISSYDIYNINQKKIPNINNLKNFLKLNSTIEDKIYIHRIYKMYSPLNQFDCDFNSNCSKSSYFNKLKLSYKQFI